MTQILGGIGVSDGGGGSSSPGTGTGDVVGPASAVDDRIATYDGATGKLIQDGGATIADVLLSAAAGVVGSLTTPRIPFFGAGSVLDDDPALKWDDTNKKLVLATTGQTFDAVPTNEAPQLHVGGDYNGVAAGQGSIMLDGYGAQSSLTMRRADGTQASKSALADAGIVFNFRSYGYDGSAFALAGNIRMIANGAWTGSNHGHDFLVLLTANGSTASPTEKLRVTSRGNVTIKENGAGEPSTGTMGLFLGDGTVPATLASNTAGLYSNDVGGTTELFGINEAGQAVQLTAPPHAITAVFDGGGLILTAKTVYVQVPYACTVTGWRIVANAAGTAVVGVWKAPYSSFPPVVGDAIAGTEKPTLSGPAQKNEDLTLSTWTDTTIDAGDYLAFDLESGATVCTWLSVQLLVRKGT